MRTGYYFMLSLCLSAAFPHSGRAHLLEHSFSSASSCVSDVSTPRALVTFMPQSFIPTPGLDSIGEVENATSMLTDSSENSVTVIFHPVMSKPSCAMAPFNGVIFCLTTGGSLQIASVAVNAATTFRGFDAPRVAFSHHDAGFNWSGLSDSDGEKLVVEFAFIKGNPLQPWPSDGDPDMWTFAPGAILIAWVRLRWRLRF